MRSPREDVFETPLMVPCQAIAAQLRGSEHIRCPLAQTALLPRGKLGPPCLEMKNAEQGSFAAPLTAQSLWSSSAPVLPGRWLYVVQTHDSTWKTTWCRKQGSKRKTATCQGGKEDLLLQQAHASCQRLGYGDPAYLFNADKTAFQRFVWKLRQTKLHGPKPAWSELSEICLSW